MKKFLFSLLSFASIFSSGVFANGIGNLDWKPVQSCIELNQHLSKFLKNHPQQKKLTPQADFSPLLAGKSEEKSSELFFTTFDAEKKILTLIQGPQAPQNPLINFTYAKKIAQLKLPKSFSEIQTLFFKDQLFLLIAQEKLPNRDTATLILIYELNQGKLSPLHVIKQS